MQIDKAIPIPRFYPFEQMEVGDSFVLPHEKRNAAQMAMRRFSKQTNRKFVMRVMDSGELRCWRVL